MTVVCDIHPLIYKLTLLIGMVNQFSFFVCLSLLIVYILCYRYSRASPGVVSNGRWRGGSRNIYKLQNKLVCCRLLISRINLRGIRLLIPFFTLSPRQGWMFVTLLGGGGGIGVFYVLWTSYGSFHNLMFKGLAKTRKIFSLCADRSV